MSYLKKALKPLIILTVCFQTSCIAKNSQKSKDYADSPTQNRQASDQNPAFAKNVIIFIGDGMGVSTITAARIFDGQSKGGKGEDHALAFEDFEHLALIKTYNSNSQVPDSAGTATAIFSGYKTNIGAINVKPGKSARNMVISDCVRKKSPPTLAQNAKKAGLSIGIVSTTRITHATPAATYGHAVSRNWEAQGDIDPRAAKAGCKSLADQMLAAPLDIILGGGSKKFSPEQIEDWQGRENHIFVTDKSELGAAPKDKTVLGLFNADHMSFEADRSDTQEPSLADMTAFALDALSERETGYILTVEAGRVDHAHHATNAYRALRDMQALNEAVKVAKEQAGQDTLIMVTADHSHVFTIAGYPVRGNPILGLVKSFDRETGEIAQTYEKDADGKPYTTLGYHNGPNPRTHESHVLTDNAVQAKDFRQHSAVHLKYETHSGEDVPLYARGPGAHRVKGVMEQDEIYRVMTQALGWE